MGRTEEKAGKNRKRGRRVRDRKAYHRLCLARKMDEVEDVVNFQLTQSPMELLQKTVLQKTDYLNEKNQRLQSTNENQKLANLVPCLCGGISR